MPPTNAPAQVPAPAPQPSTPQRNERPVFGQKEPKFVIKLSCPVPA